ncbi:MAG TPA: hypothetical protein VKX30_07080 [Flavobacteriaceae bacterium]|nr:hypothetical protein [Flavobacteriaceae bacterium]
MRLEGVLQDSIGEPVMGVNLIATPLLEGEQSMTFAISDEKGKYQLNLDKETPYKMAITSIGFASITDSLRLSTNTIKDYILKRSVDELETVIIKAKMAMIVKEDTITYRTDKFKTGNERKLRELLKNLPGVEVDRAGNVTVNGKAVTDFLVDGKSFFGGDTKLGVNNIPAEVVDEVEVVDDFHEVSFMKGLEASDRMAMNIKLKEGRNRFVFGETEVGGGDEKRYYIHPTLFYYSPKTTANFIGSFNNINESPLSFQDVVRFKGGYESMGQDLINTGDDGLAQFSTSQDVLHKKSLFGAANFTHNINDKLRVDLYSIVNQQKSEAFTTNEIQYLTQDNLIETRESSKSDRGLSLLNNLKLRYQPSSTKDIAYNFMVNRSNGTFNNAILSDFADVLNQTNTFQNPYSLELTQHLRFNSQPTYEHTSRITANHTFKKENHITDWLFDKPIFSGIIPSVEEEEYNFLHDYTSTTNTGRFEYKHYWVVNPTNHIYPVAGFYFYHQNYTTTDYQLLEDGTTNSFASAGFDNALRYQLLNPYIGLQYKFQLGDVIFRPGAIYHQYFWQANQFKEQVTKQNKGTILPEFLLEFKQSQTKTLKLEYNLKSTFVDASEYANRFSLIGFNQLYRGNEDLENALYHALSVNYRGVNRLRGMMYNLNFSYNRREKSIRQTTLLDGINQVSTSVYTDLPENNYNAFASINKRWSFFSLSFAGQAGLADYSHVVNNEQLDYQSHNFGYRMSATTFTENWPFIRIGFNQYFFDSKSDTFKNNYWTADPYIELQYNLGGFIFKTDYRFTYNKQKSTGESESYQMGNASLYFNKEDSSWGFEVRVSNLFNLPYKRRHSFNQFMVYDQWTYVQPRIVLFILSYKI